jgi:site-specific DNA-methyltransferase (adenine-specific)
MSLYYEDDSVRLYHGDCLTEHREWLTADVLVTDPPYGIGWRRGANTARKSNSHDGIQNDGDTAVRDAVVGLWGNLPGVVFGSVHAAFVDDYAHLGFWEKPSDAGVVGSKIGLRRDVEAIFFIGKWPKRPPFRGSVFRSRIPNIGNPSSPAGRHGHPHAKPGDLMEELIDMCPPGTIADPFSGSGSTLVAAKALGRRAIGVELDERYCETAARRLSQEVLDLGSIA